MSTHFLEQSRVRKRGNPAMNSQCRIQRTAFDDTTTYDGELNLGTELSNRIQQIAHTFPLAERAREQYFQLARPWASFVAQRKIRWRAVREHGDSRVQMAGLAQGGPDRFASHNDVSGEGEFFVLPA